MKNIVWLSSYPKSGNTWVRIFLANLLKRSSEPVDINKVKLSPNAASLPELEEALGFPTDDLAPNEIEKLLPEFYRYTASATTGTLFLKNHSAYIATPSGQPLFPADASKLAVYIIRNPLDVCVSYAHFLGTKDFAMVARKMGEETNTIAQRRPSSHRQFRQPLLTWSQHVQSWTKQKEIPALVLRYEDLLNDPILHFTRLANACEISASDEEIKVAIRHSSFNQLQTQEQIGGFRERPPQAERFFRKGLPGNWESYLQATEIETLRLQQGDTMREFGYY